MKKSHIATLAVFLLAIPATLALGMQLPGRRHYLTSTLVILEILIPFFLAFEGKRPQARELVIMAVLCALAVAARVAVPIPNFKAIYGVIMIAGIALGPESGFLVGAVAAFISHFFRGHGVWTPWQMLAYGACGMILGFLFRKNKLPRKPLLMGVVGFLVVMLFAGPLLDTCKILMMSLVTDLPGVLAMYGAGFAVNLSQGISTFIVLFLLGKPLLGKLDRIKLKYGMEERL